MFLNLCDAWAQVRGQLEVLRGACREVQGSQNFTTLLRAILALGNHLNEGTHKGNASGFTLPPPLLPPVPLHCKPPPPPKSPPPLRSPLNPFPAPQTRLSLPITLYITTHVSLLVAS